MHGYITGIWFAGVCGGHQTAGAALGLPLLVLSVLAMTVSDDVLCDFALLYSQHGNTRCPDGAVSNWNDSVPGGNPTSILMSPGPQKCSFRVLKSNTARFFCRAASPSSPGRSESGTDGIVRFPIIEAEPSPG